MEKSQELALKCVKQHHKMMEVYLNQTEVFSFNLIKDFVNHHSQAICFITNNDINGYENYVLNYLGHPAPSYYSWKESIQQPVNQ